MRTLNEALVVMAILTFSSCALGAQNASRPGDFSTADQTDAMSLFTQDGLAGPIHRSYSLYGYAGKTNLKDPILSPIFSHLHGFPPTLFISSTRDMLLSGTTILHRAFLRAGVDAQLIVFEGLSHGFWLDPYLPESKEAYGYMSSFFEKQLHLVGKIITKVEPGSLILFNEG